MCGAHPTPGHPALLVTADRSKVTCPRCRTAAMSNDMRPGTYKPYTAVESRQPREPDTEQHRAAYVWRTLRR